jgi:hypothetical protein
MEACLCNHCCSRKAINITFSEEVCVCACACVCVRACGTRARACACTCVYVCVCGRAPYCHLWPAPLTSLRHAVVTHQLSMYYVVLTQHLPVSHAVSLSHVTKCSPLTILRNVRGTSIEVKELVQVHHLTILTFKDLLNQ